MGAKARDKDAPGSAQQRQRQPHTFDAKTVAAAIAYWKTLPLSRQYTFRGSNTFLFAQMMSDPEMIALANPIFHGQPPTATSLGMTTDGRSFPFEPEGVFQG